MRAFTPCFHNPYCPCLKTQVVWHPVSEPPSRNEQILTQLDGPTPKSQASRVPEDKVLNFKLPWQPSLITKRNGPHSHSRRTSSPRDSTVTKITLLKMIYKKKSRKITRIERDSSHLPPRFQSEWLGSCRGLPYRTILVRVRSLQSRLFRRGLSRIYKILLAFTAALNCWLENSNPGSRPSRSANSKMSQL